MQRIFISLKIIATGALVLLLSQCKEPEVTNTETTQSDPDTAIITDPTPESTRPATESSDNTKFNTSDYITTESGLLYKDIAVGEGEFPNTGDDVTVHYTGTLFDQETDIGAGQKFDSSRDRGDPFVFPIGIGRVIKGWDEGVSTMKPGGKRILIVPPDLGYGAQGAGGVIPPNATLVFDVERLQ